MAGEPPLVIQQPPNLVPEERYAPLNKTQQESQLHPISNSTKLKNNLAIPVEISKEELLWVQQIIDGSQM